MEKVFKTDKKIFHISDALPDYHKIWGGAEKVAYRQIKMSGCLENYKIFVGVTKPQRKIEEFRFFTIYTIEDFLPPKIRSIFTAFKNQVIPFDIISFFSLLFIFLRVRPSIIHIHKTVRISLTPIIAARLFKIPIILAVYDYWFFCPGRLLIDKEGNPCYKFHGPWCRRCSITKGRLLLQLISMFRRKVFDFFLKKVDRFSVLSQTCKDLISQYPIAKKKIFIVHQLLIKLESVADISQEPNSIFFNTWMLPHKGVHIIVQAFNEIIKKNPQAKLYLAIKDANDYSELEYFKKIKTMIENLNLKDKIYFINKPNHQEYLKLIKKANVVVVAEQWENMAPTTLTDAMSFGKAIVASRIGGIPEMIKDGKSGLLANPKNPKDFAEKIIKILSNPDLARKLSQQAIQDIKDFGSEEIVQSQLLSLYKFEGID